MLLLLPCLQESSLRMLYTMVEHQSLYMNAWLYPEQTGKWIFHLLTCGRKVGDRDCWALVAVTRENEYKGLECT